MLSDSNLVQTDIPCHICQQSKLSLFPSYPSLPRVASDCTPWRAGGKLAICGACDCVQNPVDNDWQQETNNIYSRYKLYRQSSGNEQGVIADGNKQLMPRSAKVFHHTKNFLDLDKPGRLLDIGCANGELLRIFGAIAPHWHMVGFEIDDKCREEVLTIPNVEAFVSGSLTNLKGKFDIITLIHVLEHLPYPKKWLESLHQYLSPNGVIIIQLPDPKQNPFNLLVADHCSHFIIADVIKIVEQAGYKVLTGSEEWIPREFSLVITPLASNKPAMPKAAVDALHVKAPTEHAYAYPVNSLVWLHDIEELLKSFPKNKPRGIWGTAIAATWFYSIMVEVDFFVDEDTHRIGQMHLGKPIYHPESVPAESNIFIALIPEIAEKIKTRWQHTNMTLYVPPVLQY